PATLASSHEPAVWNEQQRLADLFRCGRLPARGGSSGQRLPGLACGDTGPAAGAARRLAVPPALRYLRGGFSDEPKQSVVLSSDGCDDRRCAGGGACWGPGESSPASAV